MRRLQAQEYAKLPSEHILKAAKELEEVRDRAISKIASHIIQSANFIGVMLSNKDAHYDGWGEDAKHYREFMVALAKSGKGLIEMLDSNFDEDEEVQADDTPGGMAS